jgi:hypothetical protein
MIKGRHPLGVRRFSLRVALLRAGLSEGCWARIRRLAHRPFAGHQELLADGPVVSGRI